MSNWYTTRNLLKDAINLPASSTGDHDQLDMSLETGSRLVDDWIGYHLYPALQTRYLRARESMRLRLDKPILSITTLRTDAGDDSSYESTWATTQYDLAPYNATGDSPPQPYWDIEVRASSTNVFPSWVRRGVELTGIWGQYNQRDVSTAVLSADANATALTLTLTGATSIQVGHTIRVGTEDMFVTATPASSTGAHTSGITVERGRNGTSGTTHSSATSIEIYRYPIAERAVLYQAQQDFRRGLADPSAGSPMFGQSGQMGAEGDLHPAVRRMLRSLRTPVVG